MLFEKKENENKSTAIQFVYEASLSIKNDKLSNAFKAAVLLYYDKFGENKLIEAATCLELIISEKRFSWASTRPSPIRIESALTYVKNSNIILIILNSVIVSHVIVQLEEKINVIERETKESPTLNSYFNAISEFYKKHKYKIENNKIVEKLIVIYKL